MYFVLRTFSGSLYLSSCTWKLGTSSGFSFAASEKEIWEPCGQETEKLNIPYSELAWWKLVLWLVEKITEELAVILAAN